MTATTSTRPTCDHCDAVFTPTGAHWDGTNTHIEAMARAAGWRVWAGVTHSGKPAAVVICPDCVGGAV